MVLDKVFSRKGAWKTLYHKCVLIVIFFLGILFTSGSSRAATEDIDQTVVVSDTLVSLVGKVLNAETKEPVQAKLVFHRLPHGGNVGASKVKNPEGDYRLTLMKSYEYTVTLNAEGYLTKNEIITTSNPEDLKEIPKNFYLVPMTVGQTVTLKSLIFEQSKTNITSASYEELNQLVSILKKNPQMVIQLEGHTDFKGRAALNMELAQSRVEAVKDYLVSKGIKSKKIKLKAYGGSKPLSRAISDEKRSINRRVEVRIIKN